MNVIIDGNAFLNVSISIVKNMLKADKRIGEKYYVNDLFDSSKFSLKEQAGSTFKKFTVNYFSSIISPFKGSIGAVFFVFDSKSWRKEYIKNFFEKQETEPHFEYKANRKYDDKMYLFFDFFQTQILAELKKMGAESVRVTGAEGDDLIAHIIKNTSEDTCIWSVDKDLIQLIKNDSRFVFLVTPKMMTKNKRMFTSIKSAVEKKSVDLFSLSADAITESNSEESIKELVSRGFVNYETDPTQELIVKILAGDDSDSIPRIHPKMTKTKVESVLTKLKHSKGWPDLLSGLHSLSKESINLINELVINELKLIDQELKDKLRVALEFNIKLICLSEEVLPQKLIQPMLESIDFSKVKRFDLTSFKKYHSNEYSNYSSTR